MKTLTIAIAAHVCINFDAGEKAFQKDVRFFCKCVRPKGFFSCYWVDPDQVAP